MVRRHAVVALVAATLLVPGTALAGGWATVSLSSLPDGTPPGGTWTVRLTVLQHGRTPLAGVTPKVIVRHPSGRTGTFIARPTGRAGVYRARVVFPSSGRFTYVVDDGFTAKHSFAPVTLGGERGVGETGPARSALLAALGAGLLAGLVTWAWRHRRSAGLHAPPA